MKTPLTSQWMTNDHNSVCGPSPNNPGIHGLSKHFKDYSVPFGDGQIPFSMFSKMLVFYIYIYIYHHHKRMAKLQPMSECENV